MKSIILSVCLASVLMFAGCKNDDDNPVTDIPIDKKPTESEFFFEFDNDTEGWIGDFADYPNHDNIYEFYELDFDFSTLPEPLDRTNGAIMQTGNNHSDDLFMFVKRKISGLEANAVYEIDMEIEIATNAASGRMGVGGAPGESVHIKAGAASIEPIKVLDNSDSHFRMNIDKGNQAMGGENMELIGHFANGTDEDIYTLKLLKTSSPIDVTSNENGELWLIVGTDSGFEATTTIYYNYISADIEKK